MIPRTAPSDAARAYSAMLLRILGIVGWLALVASGCEGRDSESYSHHQSPRTPAPGDEHRIETPHGWFIVQDRIVPGAKIRPGQALITAMDGSVTYEAVGGELVEVGPDRVVPFGKEESGNKGIGRGEPLGEVRRVKGTAYLVPAGMLLPNSVVASIRKTPEEEDRELPGILDAMKRLKWSRARAGDTLNKGYLLCVENGATALLDHSGVFTVDEGMQVEENEMKGPSIYKALQDRPVSLERVDGLAFVGKANAGVDVDEGALAGLVLRQYLRVRRQFTLCAVGLG